MQLISITLKCYLDNNPLFSKPPFTTLVIDINRERHCSQVIAVISFTSTIATLGLWKMLAYSSHWRARVVGLIFGEILTLRRTDSELTSCIQV